MSLLYRGKTGKKKDRKSPSGEIWFSLPLVLPYSSNNGKSCGPTGPCSGKGRIECMVQVENLEFPREETESRVEFARELVSDLGKRLKAYRSEVGIHNSESSEQDRILMQKADLFVEEKLIPALREKFPHDAIVSEEAGDAGSDGEFCWYLDPVDGTRNFIHGVPLFSISAGLSFRDVPVAGVVHAPALVETYHAVYGLGAYKNDLPIQVSSVEGVERTLVSNGLPFHRREIITEILADLSAFITSGTGLRRTGSAILDICWIAEGRFDAMWERGMKPWDLCAASVILGEAGGRITGFAGEPFQLKMPGIVASNSVIHDQVVAILQEARRVEGVN